MTVHELRPTGGVAGSDDTTPGGTSPDSTLSGSSDELWGWREQSGPEDAAELADIADGGPRGLWASVWPRVLAVLVVASVGLPAAVASYWHLQEVAARFNPGSALAYWLPLSVDGLLAAALVVVWSRRTRGERVGFGPWAAFAFGMIVTLLANAASVVPESEWVRPGSVLASVAAWMVALFPPVAFAVSLELIAIVLRPTRRRARAIQHGRAGRRGTAAVDSPVTGEALEPAAAPVPQMTLPAISPAQSPASAPAAAGLVGAVVAPGRDTGDTVPLPAVAPADAAVGSGSGVAGQTKQGRAEALFMAAWDRGEDLSLAEVDRRIGGNRTAAKAKRSLRDRGLLPPAEHLRPAPRADAGRASTQLTPA